MVTQQAAPRPRLIILTQWFDPEPALKGMSFARRLAELGFDVEVVTGFPNYPGGKVYDGYRIRPIVKTSTDGITLTRLALYPSHDRSRLGRILNYVSFFLSAAFYLTFFARRADLVYAYHPPLTVALAGVVAKYLRRTPLILDVQDMWPDTLRATGMVAGSVLLKFVGVVSRWVWRSADHIAVLSPGFRALLIERGIPEDRVSVIYNWADESDMGRPLDVAPDPLGEPGKFRVLFAGNMGPAQGLDTVLDAAAIVGHRAAHIEFCFLGSGIDLERLQTRAERERLMNVRFLPRVPKGEAGAWLSAADCTLVHLRADPLFAITIPSKTQAYMAAGKPIVMAAVGDAANLIQRADCGVVVPPENPEALAAAVIELAELDRDALRELGDNARRFYDANLSFAQGVQAMADVYRKVLQGRRAADGKSDGSLGSGGGT
jgi:colanic acid biosynthesis glycosyl transferase WcaI